MIVIMMMTMIIMMIRRIRDQMDDKEVQKRVKMVDTASFSVLKTHSSKQLMFSYLIILQLGILTVMFAEFLLVGYPGGFPWFYLVMNNILMLFRSVTPWVRFV